MSRANPDPRGDHPARGRHSHRVLGRLLMFERRRQPLVPLGTFGQRVLTNTLAALLMIGVSLGIGVLGYHATGGLGWLDSLYNAAMILTGMGPADPRRVIPDAEKWFASFYALFAGIVFLASVGVLMAPVVHRFLHHFHLELDEEDGP